MEVDINLGLALPGVTGAVARLFNLIDFPPGKDSRIVVPIVIFSKSI